MDSDALMLALAYPLDLDGLEGGRPSDDDDGLGLGRERGQE